MSRSSAPARVAVVTFIAIVAQRDSVGPVMAQVPFTATQGVPVTAPHVDTLHGTVVSDPYRWLEAVDSAPVRAWVRDQDRRTRLWLGSIPTRARLQSLVSRVAAAEAFSPAPVKENGLFFISKITAVGPQRGISLLVRDSATGTTKTLIDVDAQQRMGRPVRQARPSADGELVAYAEGTDSTEWTVVRVRSVKTGQDLRDSVAGVYRFAESVSWSRRGGHVGFFYTRFAMPPGAARTGRPGSSGAVYFHRVGDPQSADRLVFDAGHPTDVLTPTAVVTDDGRWVVITVRRGTTRASAIHMQDASSLTTPPRLIVENDGANYIFLGNHGSALWVATDNGAPRGRVIAVDVTRPGRAHWRELVPEASEAIDTWSYGAAIGGNLLVLYRRDAVLLGKVFDANGRLRYELPIPGRGSVWSGFSGKTTSRAAYFSVNGVADPGTMYRLDIQTGTVTPFLRPSLPYDPSAIVTEQVFYTATDGARIPMYVVRHRDTPRDGKAPLWIYGYGAQRWAAAPWFQPPIAAWLLEGGVWAVPNTRGGAEYGEEWFQAGSRRNKQRAIDDYIDAVEWLIANGYTAARRVVAHTSSAGGVLVAAAVQQRPELFGAAVMEYPILDMLRYEHLLTGNRWTDDYGTIKDSGDFRAMLAYTPIQNGRAGACHAPTLVTPGEFDRTAAPAHSYKLVGTLQHTQGCRQNPILLRVSWRAGHTAGATLDDALGNWVDQLAFARKVLGGVDGK